jgi:hypothetical protein
MERVRVSGIVGPQGKSQIDSLLTESVAIEYFHQSRGEREFPGDNIFFLCIADSESFDALQSSIADTFPDSEFLLLPDSQILFPIQPFNPSDDLEGEDLRVGDSTPIIDATTVTYTFTSAENRDMIYRVYSEYLERPDWTHFACFPIAPVFPDVLAALTRLFTDWRIPQEYHKNCKLYHITLILFVLKNQADIEIIDQLIQETIPEVDWPEDRTVSTQKLSFFGKSARKATILHALPEGEFMVALATFQDILAEKARTKGFTRMEIIDKFHATLVRPKWIGGWRARFFDAQKLIDSFQPGSIPDIQASEIRFVKRREWDADGFYHLEKRYIV